MSSELLGVLCVLGIVLAVVAVIGHGIWVAVGWLVRTIGGAESAPLAHRPTRCQRCDTAWEAGRSTCLICEWPDPLSLPHATSRAYRQLREQLDDWRRGGVISDAAFQSFLQTLDDETARIGKPVTTHAPVAPTPVVVPRTPPTVAPLPLATSLPPLPIAPAAPRVETMAEKLRQMTERPPVEEMEAVEVAVVAEIVESGDRPVPLSPTPAPLSPMPAPLPPRPVPTYVPPVPLPPRRSFGEIFVSFMEEKNIRWGELVGGLLIVCCSIALVISFWSAIAERPVLKYIVFNGVTTALFGVAYYTERRWKLPNTSRGLFIISALLVPLNFLAMAAFSTTHSAPVPLTIVGEVLSIVLFSALLWLAGRSLTPHFALVLAPAMMISALAELLVRHFIVRDVGPSLLLGVGALPVVAMLGTAWAMRSKSEQWEAISESHAHEMFRLLGLVTFAGLAAAGLLIFRAGATAHTFEVLSPLIALYACGPLAVGLLLWRRLRDSDLGGLRIAGTAIAVGAVMLMLLAAALAWPQPALLATVLAIEALVLLTVAWVARMPAAVTPGSLCASVAYLVAWLGYRGAIAWNLDSSVQLVKAMLNADTGKILVGSAIVCGAAAAWRAVRGDRETARYFGAAAGMNAIVSLAAVTAFGFGRPLDPHQVTWVYALYGVAALVAARWAVPQVLGTVGSLLLLAASVQGIVFGEYGDFEYRWLMAMLVHATAFTLLRVVAEAWPKLAGDAWRETIAVTAALTNSFAFLFALAGFLFLPAGEVALYLAWISAVWLALAYLMRTSELFGVFQITATLALLCAVTGQLQQQAWYQSTKLPLLDPWALQAFGIALAASFLVWKGLFAALLRMNPSLKDSDVMVSHDDATWRHRMLGLTANSGFVGRVALAIALMILLGNAIYAAMPGSAQELSPRSLASQMAGQSSQISGRIVAPASAFELLGVSHLHAAGAGAWGLLATVAVAILVELRERFTRPRLILLLSVASLSGLLIAATFEPQVAVASALRWTGAIYLLVVSALVWFREPLSRLAARWGCALEDAAPERHGADAWVTSLVGLLLPLVAMGVFIGGVALWQRPPEAAMQVWFFGLLALFSVAGVVGVVLMRLEQSTSAADVPRTWAGDVGRLVAILGAMPLVVVVLYVMGSALRGNPITGPEPGSLFASMGLATSYAGPLALVTLALFGHAIRERSSSFALSAGLMLNLSATAGFLLYPWPRGLTLNAELWVQLAQLNAGVSAAFAILWSITAALFRRRNAVAQTSHDACLAVQSTMGLVLLAIVFVPAALSFWWEASLLNVHFQIGTAAGWWSLGLAVVAAVLNFRVERSTEETAPSLNFAASLLAKPLASTGILAAAAWGLSVMATFSVGLATQDDWQAFHTLLGSHILSAVAMLALGLLAVRTAVASRRAALCVVPWVLLFTFLTCAVSIRGTLEEHLRPSWWWSLAGCLASAALLAVTAAFAERRRYLYFAAACVNLAAMTWFVSPANLLVNRGGDIEDILHFVWTNTAALAIPVALWLWIERRFIEPNSLERKKTSTFGVHRFATASAMLLFAATVAFSIFVNLVDKPIVVDDWLGWTALGATFLAALACLWDPRVKGGALSLYLLGIVGIGFAVERYHLPFRWLLFNGAVIGAAYAIATSYLWSRREGLMLLGRRLKMPVDERNVWRSAAWLVPANSLLVTAVVALTGYIVLTFDDAPLRLLAAKAAWFQVVAFLFLTRGAPRNDMQFGALTLGVVGAILWGWAWLAPQDGPQYLDRGVIVMAVLAASGLVYGFGLTKFFRAENPWTQAGLRMTPFCIGAALVSLAVILGGEVFAYVNFDHVEISHWAEAVVGASLLGLAAAGIVAAVVPGRDPLGLSERGRQAYVYGAEVLLAATALHVRICFPEWFRGFIEQYWPFLLMGISFLGVGLSEWFRRRQLAVLSEPLERTGALLPLLPAIGFWAMESNTHYSAVLLMVGALYASLSVLRKSFGFGVLAALAVNGGLWYFLHHNAAISILKHPQVWLIPPAVCVLAASYLNRVRLTGQQMTQIRYLCAMVIYVSSTADIFLNGMEDSPWLALVLGALSVVGVMAGILFRVRAFLYLGTTFLCMSLISMIWWAKFGLHQDWVPYACGILLGAIILAAFAIIEKKRTEFQHMLGKLKEWEA
jgi:hypothetical protein